MTAPIPWVYLNVIKTNGLDGFLPASLLPEPLTGKQQLKGPGDSGRPGPDGSRAGGTRVKGSSGQEEEESTHLTTGSPEATWAPRQTSVRVRNFGCPVACCFPPPGVPSLPSPSPGGPALSSCCCTRSRWAAGMDRWGLLAGSTTWLRKPGTGAGVGTYVIPNRLQLEGPGGIGAHPSSNLRAETPKPREARWHAWGQHSDASLFSPQPHSQPPFNHHFPDTSYVPGLRNFGAQVTPDEK